jgi:NADH-quinone oxidoreductase subunit L
LAYFIFQRKQTQVHDEHSGIKKILFHKYYIDEIYEFIIVRPFLFVSKVVAFVIDTKLIDRFFVGIGLGISSTANVFKRLQTGFVGDYALYIVIGSFCILVFLLTRGV